MGNCKSEPDKGTVRHQRMPSSSTHLELSLTPAAGKVAAREDTTGTPLVTIFRDGVTPVTGEPQPQQAASLSFYYPESPELGPRNDTTAFSNGSFANGSSAFPLITSDVLRQLNHPHFPPLAVEDGGNMHHQAGAVSDTPIPSMCQSCSIQTPVPIAEETPMTDEHDGPKVESLPVPLTKSMTQEFAESHSASMSARELSSIQNVRSWLMTTSSMEGTDEDVLSHPSGLSE